jgi:hypothetical protein
MGDQPQDETSKAPLNPMQEPLGSMDRQIPRTSDDNDVNIAADGAGRSADNLGRTPGTLERGRGFTTTFAVVAAILVVALLVALYLGSGRSNQATAPADSQPPVAESTPGTTGATGDTTGSTTPAAPQETAPAGGTGTGTGTTAPATP